MNYTFCIGCESIRAKVCDRKMERQRVKRIQFYGGFSKLMGKNHPIASAEGFGMDQKNECCAIMLGPKVSVCIYIGNLWIDYSQKTP